MWLRRTVSVIGLPCDALILFEILSGSTTWPLIAITWSPGRRCAIWAGVGRPLLLLTRSATLLVGFQPAVMNTIANSTIAKSRLVTGPAAMAATRFQVGARQ